MFLAFYGIVISMVIGSFFIYHLYLISYVPPLVPVCSLNCLHGYLQD